MSKHDESDGTQKLFSFCLRRGKTEPCYFQDLRNNYDLNTANIEVCGECGSGMMSSSQNSNFGEANFVRIH